MQTHGKGKLVPTGKSEPTFDVSYGISHHVSDVNRRIIRESEESHRSLHRLR
jgi:hypothetical protein